MDWTQAAANATPRTFDKKVRWPGSEKIANAGFSDSFRAVHPNEVSDTGYTWTRVPGANEVHDRIDFVYSRGPSLSTTSSVNIGPTTPDPNTHIFAAGYNSDHRAVGSGFSIVDLQDSTLTFSRLAHNPGNSSALNAGNYGDRLVSTPNIAVEFLPTGNAFWDTYDGDRDNNGNNLWNVGVAQLQSTSGIAEFDAAFTPDVGFGVIVDGFDLVDYFGFASGHTVRWELWSGAADLGTLLKFGTETVAANGINSVQTNCNQAVFGMLTLRLEHLDGNRTDLANDNISF